MTRVVLVGSALVYVAFGLASAFVPEALVAALGLPGAAREAMPLVTPAALGFAAVDWYGRGAVYGGIYGKPIVMGNVFYSVLTTVALATAQLESATVVGVLVTAVFAIAGGLWVRLLLRPPFGMTAQ